MEIGFGNEAARCSAIAQLVEQATVNRPVVGSSPTRGASASPSPKNGQHVHRLQTGAEAFGLYF